MTPTETTAILRKVASACRADEYLWGTSLPGVPTEVVASVESAIAMIERIKAMEDALREIVWSNDSVWQSDRARAALEESKCPSTSTNCADWR